MNVIISAVTLKNWSKIHKPMIFLTSFCLLFIFLNKPLPVFPPVRRPTKAQPHPSMSRTCSPTATTVSGCVLSGSARTHLSWVAPTAPQWPSPLSGTRWRWAAARPAQGPGPARSQIEPDEAWQTSSALSSSSWFSPSSPFSSLSSSSTLSLNEQFAPPSCRVIALFFPPLSLLFCILCFVLYRFLLSTE